jgi:hypothetical protein
MLRPDKTLKMMTNTCDMMTHLHDDMLKRILKYSLDHLYWLIRVCKRWMALLIDTDLVHAYVPTAQLATLLPAFCYPYLTFAQKITLANDCACYPTTTLSRLKKEYRVIWLDIIGYVDEQPCRLCDIFSMISVKLTELLSGRTVQYFKYLFAKYEQYRRWVMRDIPAENVRAIVTFNNTLSTEQQVREHFNRISGDVWDFIGATDSSRCRAIRAEHKKMCAHWTDMDVSGVIFSL